MSCFAKGVCWGLLLAATILLLGCWDGADEVSRKSSPTSLADAVILESSEGATTSYTYRVCVVPTRAKCSQDQVVAVLYDAARNRSSYGVDIVWLGEKQLQIQYYTAASAVLQRQSVDVGARIDVALLPGVLNEHAKPGAMVRSR